MQSAPPALQLGNVQADPQLFSKRYQMEGGDASVALPSTPRKDTDIERKERQRNLQFLINKMEQERSIVGSVPLVTTTLSMFTRYRCSSCRTRSLAASLASTPAYVPGCHPQNMLSFGSRIK